MRLRHQHPIERIPVVEWEVLVLDEVRMGAAIVRSLMPRSAPPWTSRSSVVPSISLPRLAFAAISHTLATLKYQSLARSAKRAPIDAGNAASPVASHMNAWVSSR
jgi:hypothetical protein